MTCHCRDHVHLDAVQLNVPTSSSLATGRPVAPALRRRLLPRGESNSVNPSIQRKLPSRVAIGILSIPASSSRTVFPKKLFGGQNSSGCDAPTGDFLWVHSHPTLPRSRRLWLTGCVDDLLGFC